MIIPAAAATLQVSILLFLSFNASFVRHKYAKKPRLAYRRELNRIANFVRSARKINTKLPIYIVVGGERNLIAESELIKLGVDGVVEHPAARSPP